MATTTAPANKPAKSLAAAVDPAGHVPTVVAKALEWRGIPAIPVYARWLRVDPSSHEALVQESGHHDTWDHIELSFVHGLIPMYQKFTGNVYGDANAMALRGHNVGPMAAHVSIPPTNMLLAMHLLSSSCKWPVTARRRLHRGTSLCAFSSVFAPYLYCSSKQQEQEQPEPEPKPGGLGANAKAKATATANAMKEAGIGITMLPTGGKTVFMRLSVLDILLGALDVAIDKAIGKVLDAGWGRLVGGIDAKRHITPLTKQAGRKAASRAAGRYMRDTMLNKAMKDSAKTLLTSYELAAPFKLVSYSFVTEELKVWTHSCDGDGWSGLKIRDRVDGWKLHDRARSSEPGMPTPIELLPESEASSTGGSNTAEEPDQQVEPDYWQDPTSNANSTGGGAPESEPHQTLGPYDPGRTILDDLLEGAPHAW